GRLQQGGDRGVCRWPRRSRSRRSRACGTSSRCRAGTKTTSTRRSRRSSSSRPTGPATSEGCLRAERGKRYPVCIEGARACPPEDVGGTWGYEEYLEAMSDPCHERHEEFLGWRGPFNPEAFDPVKATRRRWRGLPDCRSGGCKERRDGLG